MATCTSTCTSNEKKAGSCSQFRPLGNRVLLRTIQAPESLKGIVIPESAKKKEERAEVIAVGPGAKDQQGNMIPMPVSIGQTVLIEKYSGQEVTMDEVQYTIVRADEIIAIIEPSK